MNEANGYLKLTAFRRLGEGKYAFSRLLFLYAHDAWSAVTLSTTSRTEILATGETTPIISGGRKDKITNPDELIKRLRGLGFVLLMSDIEDRFKIAV